MGEPLPHYGLDSEEMAEFIGRWWAMRKYAIDIGLIAERELIRAGVMSENARRFLSREEVRQLTKSS